MRNLVLLVLALATGASKVPLVGTSHHVDSLTSTPSADGAVCEIVFITTFSTVARKLSRNFVGLYTKQYETFNDRPVYRQYTFLCDAQSILSGFNNTLQEDQIDCHDFHDGQERFYLYFDLSSDSWVLGPFLGGSQHILAAQSKANSPERTDNNAWKLVSTDAAFSQGTPPVGSTVGKQSESGVHDLHDKGVGGLVKVTCQELKMHMAPAATESGLKRDGQTTVDTSSESRCIGWRKTSDCDPGGTRDISGDRTCADVIRPEWSGYCECKFGVQHAVPCGHRIFTCHDACQVAYPAVVAWSGQRAETNQLARNLVLDRGDWAVAEVPMQQNPSQWVDFDLGPAARLVRSVKLTLWGSNANPKDCIILNSMNQGGDQGPLWNAVSHFRVPKGSKSYRAFLPPSKSKMRFWRFLVKNNWGATWGMGLNRVEWTSMELPTESQADPCRQYTDCASCLHSRDHLQHTLRFQHHEYCGWCSTTATCLLGDLLGTGPAQPWPCNKWLWTTCSETDHCLSYEDCSSCTNQDECGWCPVDYHNQLGAGACRSGGCNAWAARTCLNHPAPIVKEEIKELSQKQENEFEEDEAKITDELHEANVEKRERSELVVSLCAIVGSLLLTLVAIGRWQRKQRRVRQEGMKEVGVQWDEDPLPAISNCYQQTTGTGAPNVSAVSRSQQWSINEAVEESSPLIA